MRSLAVAAGHLEAAGVRLDGPADDLDEALLEARLVGAAVGGGDDVDERPLDGVVARPPPEGDVDQALPLDVLRDELARRGEHLGRPRRTCPNP